MSNKWAEIPKSNMDWENAIQEILVCFDCWIDEILENSSSDEIYTKTDQFIRIDIADMLMRPDSLVAMERGREEK